MIAEAHASSIQQEARSTSLIHTVQAMQDTSSSIGYEIQGSQQDIQDQVMLLNLRMTTLDTHEDGRHRQLSDQLLSMESCLRAFASDEKSCSSPLSSGHGEVATLRYHPQFRLTNRHRFEFPFGSVIVSWGPLRKKRRKLLPPKTSKKTSDTEPMGFAAGVELVPARKVSRRAILAGWRLLRDQRGSPSVYPYLYCLMTISSDSRILEFAANENLQGMEDLFDQRAASISDRTHEGWTALHVAAAAGKLDSCRFLLDHHANVNSAGQIGLTPLHLAATWGHLDVIKILLEYESDPETYNQHSFNAVFEVLHSPFIPDNVHKAQIIRWIFQQEYFIVNVDERDYLKNSLLTWFVKNYPEGVQMLLDFNANVLIQGSDGTTALHCAAETGALKAVRLLLERGADTEQMEEDGTTALVKAAEQGHSQIVDNFMTIRDDASSTLSSGASSVPSFVKPAKPQVEPTSRKNTVRGSLQLVNSIIDTALSKSIRKKLEGTALLAAVDSGYWAVVEYLREAGVDSYRKIDHGYRALVRLVYDKTLEEVDRLIDVDMTASKDVAVDKGLSMSLVKAAEGGHLDVVNQFLDTANISIYRMGSGSRALVAAARHGHYEIARRLLGVVPPQQKYKALVRAGEFGHLDLVNLLLDDGTNPIREGSHGDTAIVRVSRCGQFAIVNRLLAAGADPNQYGWLGYSALVRAAYNGHLECLKSLLAGGADPNQPELAGDTALVRAARLGHTEIVNILLKAGSRGVISEKKTDGPTKALMKAAIYGRLATVQRLLTFGADPNAEEVDGNTPLMRAAENGHLDVVDLLIASGAKLYKRKGNAIMPLSRAAENGHLDVVERLLSLDMGKSEKYKNAALVRAAEFGQINVVNKMIDDGVDVRAVKGSAKAVGKAHFSMMNYWVKVCQIPFTESPMPALLK